MLKVDVSHQPRALDVYCKKMLPHVNFSPGSVILEGVLCIALLHDCYFQQCCVEEGCHPVFLHSLPFPQPLQ